MKVTRSGRRSRAGRTPSPDPGQRRAGVAGRLSGAVSSAWATATTFIGRVPGTLDATRTGGRQAARSLQGLPDPTLQWLAAGSVGLGAGLFLTGKPRLVIAATIAPAIAMGAAIVARSVERVDPEVLVPVTVVRPKRGERWRPVSALRRPRNGVKRG